MALKLSSKLLNSEDIIKTFRERPLHEWEKNYLVHYNSYWNGISTDPKLLLIPVDDHLVHRGDGVFEAFRLIDNKLYLIEPHLNRLRHSAQFIGIEVHWTNDELVKLIKNLALITNESNLIFRLFLTRGSGSFTTNPYDCPQNHLIIVACKFTPPSLDKIELGVKIGKSSWVQKPHPYSTIKSCNYLPNVLMKKEAIDRGLDFVISYTQDGYLAESSTENILILSKEYELLVPSFDHILRGTTLMKTIELAQNHLKIPCKSKNLSEEDLINALEVFMIGTTLDLIPVKNYENHSFIVGSIGKNLRSLVLKDQAESY